MGSGYFPPDAGVLVLDRDRIGATSVSTWIVTSVTDRDAHADQTEKDNRYAVQSGATRCFL